LILVPLAIALLNVFASAQYNGRNFSIGVSEIYTTSAKIYLDPNSSDIVLRNDSFPLEDIFNQGIELRYRITEPLILGLNVEYMRKTEFGRNVTGYLENGTNIPINVEDGFVLIPIEFSVYYLIPFSTEKFKFLMGGGLGYYIGEQIRKFGDVEVTNINRKTAYGVQVMISMDYMLKDNISIRTEMKFRDPQFTVTSAYTKRETIYNGTTVRILQSSFDSKVNIDGVTFILGAAFHF